MSAVRAETERARAGLSALKLAVAEAESLALRAAVKAAEDSAKATTLWKDRHPADGTRSTIRGKVEGSRGTVSAGGASKFLENGTIAHRIVARNARFLHFWSNGQAFFRKAVNHPGTAPRPFMRAARDIGELAGETAAHVLLSEAIARA